MYNIHGASADEVWSQAVECLLDQGKPVTSRVALTLELHPVTLEVHNPQRRLVTSYGRPVNPTFALAEVIWILCGRNDVKFLQEYNSKIGQFSDDGERFNAAYGERVKTAHGHDQLDDMIRGLNLDPESRQAVLNIWLPSADRLMKHEFSGRGYNSQRHTTKDRACNLMSHALIRDSRLEWMQVMRSNDAIWGTPNNFMQWMHVQEYVANSVGMGLGTYYHIADSFHIYDYHQDEARKIVPFDLYGEMHQYGHDHMDVGSPVLAELQAFCLALHQCKGGDDTHRNINPGIVGPYWGHVAEILTAWHFWKQGDDLAAFMQLQQCKDEVLAASQMRYFWWFRWGLRRGSSTVEDLVDRIAHLEWSEATKRWITAGVKEK